MEESRGLDGFVVSGESVFVVPEVREAHVGIAKTDGESIVGVLDLTLFHPLAYWSKIDVEALEECCRKL